MDSKESDKDKEESLDGDATSEAPKEDSLEEKKEDLPEGVEDARSDTPLGGPSEEGLESTEMAKPKKKAKVKMPAKNIYVIGFAVLFLIAGGITAFSVKSGNKSAPVATIGNQALSANDLQELASTDANVGSSAQTLTVQSSTIFSGPVLVRGALTTASNLQVGGSIQAPNITISGTANLGTAQIKSLQVAGDTVVQGATSLKDLNVSGNSTFNGNITASQITVTRLVLSGNAQLVVPNHLSFPGATPGRSVNNGVLGAGGSASIGGSDTSGSINGSTGNNPSAGCFIQVTFNQSFNNPHVIVSPVGAGAASMQYYITKTNSSFSLCTLNAPIANAQFGFDYFVTN